MSTVSRKNAQKFTSYDALKLDKVCREARIIPALLLGFETKRNAMTLENLNGDVAEWLKAAVC